MTESSDLHQKVDKILQRVESIDNIIPWIVRPQSAAIKKDLINFFGKRKRAAKIFLAINDGKTISDIVHTTGIAQPNVSAEIKTLVDYGLVETTLIGKNTFCRKNKIDKLLGLSRELENMFKQTDIKEVENVTHGDSDSSEDTGNIQ